MVDTPVHSPEALPAYKEDRRGRILAAALALLEEKEFEDITIQEVTDRAGVARATLYRYFTSKDHLYVAALVSWSEQDQLTRTVDRRGLTTDASRMRYLLLTAVRAFGRRPQLFRAEMILENSSDPSARPLFDEFANHHVRLLTTSLRDVPEDDVADIVAVAHSVLATSLRNFARGRCTLKEAERSVSRVVDLLLPADDAPGARRSPKR